MSNVLQEKRLLWGNVTEELHWLTDNMEHGITGIDVGEEGIAQSFALMSPLDQSSNVHYIQVRWHFAETIQTRAVADI